MLWRIESHIHTSIHKIRTPPLCLTESQDSRQWPWIYYLFSLCSLWPVGQNYASQSQNPAAVIQRYKYSAFQKYFHFISLKTFIFFCTHVACLKCCRILILDYCYCRTPVTATPSTPSTRTSRSAPRCSTSAGGGAADGRLCGSAKTVTPSKVEMTHGDMVTIIKSDKEGKIQILFCIFVLSTTLSIVQPSV